RSDNRTQSESLGKVTAVFVDRIAWLMANVAAGLALFFDTIGTAIVVTDHTDTARTVLAFSAILPTVLWLLGIFRASNRVLVCAGGVLVRDWFVQRKIPWRAVVSVEYSSEISVLLVTGECLRLGAVSKGLLDDYSTHWLVLRNQHRFAASWEPAVD